MRESNEVKVLTLAGVKVEQLKPVRERAVVRLLDRSVLSRREFSVVRIGYDPSDDWEVAEVVALGEGDFEPVEVGDRVIIRAGWTEGSGGKAGADISRVLGERRGSHVVIERDEIVARVES